MNMKIFKTFGWGFLKPTPFIIVRYSFSSGCPLNPATRYGRVVIVM